MAVPIIYREGQARSIASYNYVDLASGTGYVDFYAGKTVDTNRLSANAFWSDKVCTGTTSVATTTGYEKQSDVDFDIEFVLPQTVDGKTIINVPIAFHALSDGAAIGVYCICKVRKYDGTTETDLVENQSTIIATTNSVINTTESGIVCVDVDIPKTTFKGGETLRLTIELWGSVSAAATSNFFFGHDPKSRTTTNIEDDTTFDFGTTYQTNTTESNLIFQVPFRIDL